MSINPKDINQYDLNILSAKLPQKVIEYFADPKVQRKFEQWKKERDKKLEVSKMQEV